MAKKYNIKIDQGSTFILELTVTDSDGVALDLTGCTARAQVRQRYSSSTSTAFSAVVDATSSVITLTLTADSTAAITYKSGVWDCEIIYADGTVQRLLEGTATINPEVTK